jgi:rod shape determining protein RodA
VHLDLRTYLRHLDYALLLVVLVLMGYGVAMVYFATRYEEGSNSTTFATAQLLYGGVGLVAMVVLSLLDYERLRRWQWVLYGVVLGSIVLVLIVGGVTRGSRRWIELPYFNVQPSELAIVVLTVTLAAFLTDRLELLGTWRVTLLGLAYVAVPAALVFVQPDLGTTSVFIVMVLSALLFFGTPWKHFAVIAAALVGAAALALKILPWVGIHLVQEYQMNRLLVFLDPSRDPQGVGYNVRQSMIAVGSGSLTGRGERATQTTLDFLPEHHTDFIFAVIGERYGFAGGALLLFLFLVLVWRCLRIATLSRDLSGSIIAGAVATMLVFEVFVNVGMTIGIMPVTGIPLPFISYGGAALITNLMMIGVLESIHLRGKTDPGGGGLGYR